MWQALIPLFGKVFDQVFPDPQSAAEARLKVLQMQQAGELAALDADLKLALAQAATNTEEAKSASTFIAGWRPAIGWMCAIGLGYAWVAQPLLTWLSVAYGWPAPPVLQGDTLYALVTQMLGLATMRTVEKIKGVAR